VILHVHNVVFTSCQISFQCMKSKVWHLYCTKNTYCMFRLTALLEYKIALLEYIVLFVLDVLINQSIINHSSMIYCTSNQDLQSMVEPKPHLSHLWSHTLAVILGKRLQLICAKFSKPIVKNESS